MILCMSATESSSVMPVSERTVAQKVPMESTEETHSKMMTRFARGIGGFQLLDLIITELKSHMTC